MTSDRVQVVDVQAELSLDFAGHLATVTADGSHVRVRAADPMSLWQQLTTAALPSGVVGTNPARAIGQLADQLADFGLTASLDGPRGAVVTVGEPADSRLGRLLTGSSHVRFGSAAAVGPIALAQARTTLSARVILGVAAGLVAAGFGLRWRSRR